MENWRGIHLGPRKPTPEEEAEGAERIVELIKVAQEKLERAKAVNVRCKFVCNMKDVQQKKLCFAPVYSGSEENKKFFQATPGGDITFYTVNQAAFDSFEQGKEYYIDFSPAN